MEISWLDLDWVTLTLHMSWKSIFNNLLLVLKEKSRGDRSAKLNIEYLLK